MSMAPNIVYRIQSERRRKTVAGIMTTLSRMAMSAMMSYVQPQPARFNPLSAQVSSSTITTTSWSTGPMHTDVALRESRYSNQGVVNKSRVRVGRTD